jgi:putative phage-type endonuclease
MSDVAKELVAPIDRRLFLGGSDIASIFGVTPWKSAYELWEEKTADVYVQPEIEPRREKILRRGKRFEPWVIELLEEEQGINVMKRNQRYVDADFPWMACEVDFEFMSDAGLCNGEVKTISPFAASEWGEEETDEIPLYYCLQVMWGLSIKRDRPKTLVAGMIGADDLRVYQVKRDEDLIAEIRRRAYEFWTDNVQKKRPPLPQNKHDIQRALYKHSGFISPGSPELWQAAKRLKGIKAAQKRLDSASDQQEMIIKGTLYREAEAIGLTEGNSPKKFIVNDISGKELLSLSFQERKAYSVAATKFLTMRFK